MGDPPLPDQKGLRLSHGGEGEVVQLRPISEGDAHRVNQTKHGAINDGVCSELSPEAHSLWW